MKKLLLIFLLLTSCSSIGPIPQPPRAPGEVEFKTKEVIVDPVIRNGERIERDFIKHVEVFEKAYGDPVGIEMTFWTMPGDTLAVCFYSPLFFYKPSIQVDPEYWKSASEAEKEMTILHELGHCILGRDHVEGETAGVPHSLMHPNSFSTFTYRIIRKEYIKELMNLVNKPMIVEGFFIHEY